MISNFVTLNSNYMNNLETLLKERGLTKSAFSDLLGIKKQNLNGMLKNPTLETINRFASVLGVETWQLFAPSDVNKSASIICPHCGKQIEITVK